MKHDVSFCHCFYDSERTVFQQDEVIAMLSEYKANVDEPVESRVQGWMEDPTTPDDEIPQVYTQ